MATVGRIASRWGTVAQDQAIGVIGRPAINDVVDLDVVSAVGGKREVEERVDTQGIPALRQLTPFGIEDVDRAIKPTPPAVRPSTR